MNLLKYLTMKNKHPINLLNGLKHTEIKFDKSHLIEINAYKNSQNITKPFTKPISKIF